MAVDSKMRTNGSGKSFTGFRVGALAREDGPRDSHTEGTYASVVRSAKSMQTMNIVKRCTPMQAENRRI